MENEPLLPLGETTPVLPSSASSTTPAAMPTPAAQSWGAVISIIIIVLMVIIGAFYVWGQRIAQNRPAESSVSQ